MTAALIVSTANTPNLLRPITAGDHLVCGQDIGCIFVPAACSMSVACFVQEVWLLCYGDGSSLLLSE